MPRLDYFAPGVYMEEVDRGSRPIEGVQTNIAGFVGFTEAIRSGAELGKPMLVTSWSQYMEYFGKEGSDGFTDFDAYLPFAVNGWFLNGGGRCWIVSIGTKIPESRPQDGEQQQHPDPKTSAITISTKNKKESLKFYLKQGEIENGSVDVEIRPSQPLAVSEDSDEPAPIPAEFFSIVVKRDGAKLEEYDNLTMDSRVQPEVGHYVLTQLQQSEHLQIEIGEQTGLALTRRPVDGLYEVSPPPILPYRENLRKHVHGNRDKGTGIQGLYEIDEITMIACPDLMKVYEEGILNDDQLHGIMGLMVDLCENNAPNPPNRMVVLDTPPPKIDTRKPGNEDKKPIKKPQHVNEWLSDFNRRSMFAALYYPWVKVANPKNDGRPIIVPPCGHMLGVWSRTDETRGVYKAPANETPRGIIGLDYDCNFREQELLNPKGINCIRTFPDRGIKIWGARTLAETEKTEWRYINVRRLMSYIEKSIELGTQWVVFEPNDQDLWARVRRTVSNFLERLWREGALFGSTPDEAFYVKCDETINTEETMMLGRLYVEVGIRPVRPAEFVVFRISQWSPGTE